MGQRRSVLPPWLGRDCHRWAHVLPHRHREEAHDDDLWRWSEVQGLPRLLHTSPQERGLHVPDEGRRGEHPPWRGWCRCAGGLRQVPGALHQVENRIKDLLHHGDCNQIKLINLFVTVCKTSVKSTFEAFNS